MKLYHHPLSTFSRRVRMLLLEKGVEVEQISLDMPHKEHRGAAYLALNPYGRVPTLVDGDFVLYESTAILDYLEALHPTPALVPSSAKGRAKVAMHMKLCDLELASHTRSLFFPRRFLPRERWNLVEQDAAIDTVAKHLAILNRELEGKTYLVDEMYSLAEIAYTPFLAFLPLFELDPPDHVARWMRLLEERPSALATKPAK